MEKLQLSKKEPEKIVFGQSVSSGTIFFMGSELVFIVSNYLIHIGLARHLGKEAYGFFGVLMSLYLINRSFLNTGFPRAVSKFLSEAPDRAGSIFKNSIRIQLAIAGVFAFVYIIFARSIASFLKDPHLTSYLMFLGVMVIPLALLSLYTTGHMNGLRLFREQAVVKTVYPFLRMLFTLILVWLGWALWGALVGYFLAISVGVLWCFFLLRRVDAGSGDFSWKKIFYFSLPLTIASLAFTLLRNVNILFIKYFLTDNGVVGLYTAAFTLATIPFMVFAGLPLALTPSISGAFATGNFRKIQNYIQKSFRYLLFLLFPVTVLMAATGEKILALFYSSEYSSAGNVLGLLVVSSAFVAIFSVSCSITTGSGNSKIEMFWCIGVMIAMVILNVLLIPKYGMMGSAFGNLVAGSAAAIISWGYVFLKFKTSPPWKSILKITIASVLLFFAALHWQYSGIALGINYLVLGTLYFLLLYLFGEFDREEYFLIKKLVHRRA